MRNFAIRWLEPLTTVFFVFVVVWCAFSGFAVFSAAGLPHVAGTVVGLLIGVVAAVISTGVIYLLISINDHLRHIRDRAL